jgi:hypothetical protein
VETVDDWEIKAVGSNEIHCKIGNIHLIITHSLSEFNLWEICNILINNINNLVAETWRYSPRIRILLAEMEKMAVDRMDMSTML